ncbi:MAG: hypothetical protein ABWX83_04910 [Luteibacter sp.]
MYRRTPTRIVVAVASLCVGLGAQHATNITAPVRASIPSAPAPGAPPRTVWVAPVAEELIPPIPYSATVVAFVKTYIVTASYRGKPYRIVRVVVESTGLTYSTSQQGARDAIDPDSRDMLHIHVRSLAPVVFDVSATKADAHAAATRDRVAVGDLPQGHKAFALKESDLAVEVERLDDEIELR